MNGSQTIEDEQKKIQRERLGGDSQDERQNRLRVIVSSTLQRDREKHGTIPLLEQQAVKSKRQKFH